MKPRVLLFVVVQALAFASRGEAQGNGPTETPTDELNLAVGETKTLPARNVRNYSEGAPGVIEVKLTPDNAQFVLVGRRPGSTTLLLIRNDGTQQTLGINVFARAPAVVEKELKQLLEPFPDVRLRRIGARHIIDGSVRDEKEKARVDHIAQMYAGQVESTVGMGNDTFGGFDDDASRQVLIRIDFYYVQMDTTSGYNVGVRWPASIGSAGAIRAQGAYDLITRTPTQATITYNQPLPQLDIAASNGWGKVLRHATVITRNGAEARFQSGGEQNYSVSAGMSVGLQRVTYGVEVDVTPRFDTVRRELELKVDADVSDLSAPGAGTEIPSRTTSRIATGVRMKLGQSMVLSGIQTKTQTHGTNGLPLLSRIPLLGVLFGSHQDAASELEGIIYVVPSVVDSVPAAATEQVDAAIRKFDDFSGASPDGSLVPHRPAPP